MPQQKRARRGFQPLAPDREGTAMRKILAGAIAAVCLSPVALRAEVVRFDIVEREPAFAGRSFGDVGPYERITARATIALDPSDDRNAVITDLAQAPRNAGRPSGSDRRRRDPAPRRSGARQRHAAAGRAQSRPQARAATVRRFVAARREQRARAPTMPASASCTARATRWSGSAGRATSPRRPGRWR